MSVRTIYAVNIYRVFLKKAAIFQVCALCTKTKKKLPTNMCPRKLCYRGTTTLNMRERRASCITFPLQQTGDEKGNIMCNSTRHALRAHVVKCLHGYCMNLKVTVTIHHSMAMGTGVGNVNSCHAY